MLLLFDSTSTHLNLRLRHGPDELLVDGTIVHPLSKSHRAAEAKRTWERLFSDVKAVKEKPAAAIDKARATKFQTDNASSRSKSWTSVAGRSQS